MGYLLSFSKDEASLFEAFWIGFKTMDLPKFGAEVKASISLEKQIKEKSIEGGEIKLAHCPGCGQRVAQYPNLRTLDAGIDLIIEKEEFEYIRTCFHRWERIFDELREPFAELLDRFEEMKPKPLSELQKIIAERGNQ